MTDAEFDRLLAQASERPHAVQALRHADDAWRLLAAPVVSECEREAWEWLRGQLAGVLLELWQPNGRTHDPEALKAVPAERRNELAIDSYLLALGGLNLLTVIATKAVQDETAQRALTHSFRSVGEVLSDNLRTLRLNPPSWTDP